MYPAADTVPIFLAKLCILVEDPTNDELIGWDPVSFEFQLACKFRKFLTFSIFNFIRHFFVSVQLIFG